MSYSNPVIKELIRERLTAMVLKRLEENTWDPSAHAPSNLMSPAEASKAAQSAAFRAHQATIKPAGGLANKIGTAWKDLNAAVKTPGGLKFMKYGKIGVGVGAALQGLDSASTEWNENKEKGLGNTENAIKTGVRGVVAGAGAGVGMVGGASVGALAGTMILPGVGTVVGGILGGIAGGIGGGWAADKIADAATNIGEDPAAHRKFKQDAIKTEGDQRQKEADDRWSSKYGSSTDNGFGRPPKKGFGARSSRTSYQNLGGRGQSQQFEIGGAGSVNFSASQTQWDNSNYNGNRAGGPGAGEPGAGDAGEDSSASSKSSNGVTRYPTPGIDLSEPITVDSLGPAKEELMTAVSAKAEKNQEKKELKPADSWDKDHERWSFPSRTGVKSGEYEFTPGFNPLAPMDPKYGLDKLSADIQRNKPDHYY